MRNGLALYNKNMTLDPRVRQYVTPARIVWQTDGARAPRNPENLLKPGNGPCVLQNNGEAPGIVLDFGREIHGSVQIANGWTKDHRPVRVRVRFGESVSEAMSEPNNDHAVHDQTCLIPWCGHHEIGNTGFRFVRIDLVDSGRELELTSVKGVFVYRDLEYKGSFSSNDELLNRIWHIGAYTVQLCMQDLLWDGIKRDRLVWIGDMHPETMVISTVFGDVDIVPKSLDSVRDQTPLPQWMNGISSYSIWWVLIQHQWYLYHGNAAYLQQQEPYLKGLLAQLCEQVGDDNREAMGGHRFLDWPSSENPAAIHAGLHALLVLGLRAGAKLCDILGLQEETARCNAVEQRLMQYRPDAGKSKQANALMVLSGLADAAETNARILGADPFHGLSTFYGYYVLQARAQAGDYAGCQDVIRKYWGKMIELGATTFWEDFHLSWTENAAPIDAIVPKDKKDIHADFGDYCYKGLRHSLCHGWAAGPTAWMSEHVLGFVPLTPGSTELMVAPHLGDLEFAEGTFPTPAGIVKVRHERAKDGTVKSAIDAPRGVRIVRPARG